MHVSLALAPPRAENHPTDTVYEDNLIGKTFLFQFVNSYFNLFYVGTCAPLLETAACHAVTPLTWHLPGSLHQEQRHPRRRTADVQAQRPRHSGLPERLVRPSSGKRPRKLCSHPCALSVFLRSSQLGTIFVTRLVIGNIMEVCLPWLKEWWAAKKLDKEVKDMRSPAEIENERLEYVEEQWRQFVCAAVSVFECGIARLRVFARGVCASAAGWQCSC